MPQLSFRKIDLLMVGTTMCVVWGKYPQVHWHDFQGSWSCWWELVASLAVMLSPGGPCARDGACQ